MEIVYSLFATHHSPNLDLGGARTPGITEVPGGHPGDLEPEQPGS